MDSYIFLLRFTRKTTFITYLHLMHFNGKHCYSIKYAHKLVHEHNNMFSDVP